MKVAFAFTSLFGIENMQGLLKDPPEQEAPVTFQFEN
jgi:hypothetical protein